MASLEYSDAGRGQALLLIHGFPLSWKTWSAQIEGLLGSCRVIAPDLRGHGRSALPPGAPPSLDDYAADLLELLDGLRVDRFVAAGHSMGGYILFALHRLAPDRMAGAALVSTRALPDSEDAKKNRETVAQRAEKEGAGFLAEAQPAKLLAPGSAALQPALKEIIAATPGAGVAAAARAMARRPDATPQLASFKFPSTVFIGRHDQLIPPADSEAMARAIPGAKIVWCEQSGHMPMMEEAALVTRELQDLLGKTAT